MHVDSVILQRELAAPGRSRRHQYCDLIVGDRRWHRLLLYEFIMLVASGVPGAFGLALRGALYRRLLGACGRGVVFGRHVVLRHPHKIRLGDGVVIDDNVLLDAKGRANRGIDLGHQVFIGRNSILSCKDGDIVVEDRVNVGFNAEIFSGSRVWVGADTFLAAYSYLIGGDHVADDPDRPVAEQGATSVGIDIGSHGWIGAGAKVLDGVSIGEGTLVGAGAVVTRSLPAFVVAAGVPARVLRQRRAAPAVTAAQEALP